MARGKNDARKPAEINPVIENRLNGGDEHSAVAKAAGPTANEDLERLPLAPNPVAISISGTTAYTQNFNSLAVTGSSTSLPTDWFIAESGTGSNASYTAGTGSSATADSYSFGLASNSDRALGTLRSNALSLSIGATFTNISGGTINTFLISYRGEQWRHGDNTVPDRLDFQYSLDATSLTTGTWIDVDSLDFSSVTLTGGTGLRDGNAFFTNISGSISGPALANGATFWIRWVDFNVAGNDDGLAIDDFSLITPGSLAIGDVTAVEGNGSTTEFTFTVTRSGGTSGTVGATYTLTLSGSAEEADFSPSNQSGTVSFGVGETSKTITIIIQGDVDFEPNETFTVVLSAPTGGAFITDDTGLGTITNDDPAPPPGEFAIDDIIIANEGYAGANSFPFTITRTGGSAGAVSVTWTLNAPGGPGNADAADFTGPTSGTASFADGETEKLIYIQIVGDADFEPDEAFTITLSAPTGGATIADATGLGTITNDDPAPVPGTLAINDVTANEGNAGTTNFTFTVTRTGGTSGAVGASWTLTLSGAAAAGDFTAFPRTGTISFADGSAVSQTITITVQGDSNVELDELFTVVLSAPTGGATLGDDIGQGIITNDDFAINGTAGPDSLFGTGGDDVINGLAGDDDLSGLGGNDLLNGGDDSDFLLGGAGDDILNGDAGIDVLDGGADNDTLSGGLDHDLLTGGDGNDMLSGGDGDDYLRGGTLNTGGLGDDVLDGGAGYDRAGFFTYTGGVGVTVSLLLQGSAQNTGQGNDTLIGIENLSGTSFGDTLTGDGGDNWLWGSTANYPLFPGPVLQTSTTNDDTISGLGGNDLITVGIGNHVVDGGADNDTLRFTENGYITETGITLSLLLQGGAQATGNGSWTLSNFENLSGGQGGDTLTGDGNANRITGELGDDIIHGGGGDDVLSGDLVYDIDSHNTRYSGVPRLMLATDINGDPEYSGSDILDGGAGNDTALYTFEAGPGTLTVVDIGGGLLVRRDSEDIALITFYGVNVYVTGYNSGAHIGSDTLIGIEHLHFAIDGAAPLDVDLSAGVLSIANTTMGEGNGGATNFTFLVSRAGGSVGAAGATWTLTLSNDADAADFTAFPQTGTVSFADGETEKQVTITVQGDLTFEPTEYFTVLLSAPTGGAMIGDSIGQGAIVNDDAANQAPVVANAIPDQHSNEDNAVNFQFAANAFTDPDGDPLTYTATLSDNSTLPAWLVFDGPTRTFSGTPPSDFNGTISVKVTASDGSLTVTDTFDFIIDPVNDAAIIGGDTSGNVTEDVTTTFNGQLTIDDPDGPDEFSPTVATGDNGYGTFSLDAAGEWTYTLDNGNEQSLGAGDIAVDKLTIGAADGTTQVLTVTITGTNDGAIIGGTISGDVTEDVTTIASGSLTISDVDNGEAVFVAQTDAATSYGTFSIAANGAWSYQLANASSDVQRLGAGDILTDNIQVASADGSMQSIAITIHGTNDAATISGTATGDVTEDGPDSAAGPLSVADIDDGEDELAAASGGTYGLFTVPANGNWTYTLNNIHAAVQALGEGDTLTDTILVYSADGSDSEAITVTIHGTNDGAVIGGDDESDVTEDGTLTASGTLTISDVDTGEAAFEVQNAVATAFGTFSIAANGDWDYDLNNAAVQQLALGETEVETIAVEAADGTTHNVTITITGTNDAADIGGVDTGSVTEDGSLTTGGALTIADVDNGEALFDEVAAGTGTGGYGTFTLSDTGAWTYALNNGLLAVQALNTGQTLTDTLTVHSLDGTAHDIIVTINGVDETGNNDPVVTSGPGAASGSATEAVSLDGIRGADQTPNNRLEPVVDYDSAIVSLLSAHPNDMHAVLLGLQAQLPSGSGMAEAIAIVWDYVDDNFSYYNTVINEISARLTVEYALYLQASGAPLTGTAAKYTPDGGDLGTAPDRYQSLHDNILGNVNGAGLIDKFLDSGGGGSNGPPNGTADQAAYDRIIQLLADSGLSDLVNRPVYSGTEGAPNLSLAYDQAYGLLAPATGGTLTATDVDGDTPTWSGSAQGVYGAFTIAPNGVWTYLLDQFDPDTQALGAGESALDTFTATVGDGHGGSATQLVTITVNGTNDAPVGVASAVLAGGSEDVVYHVTSAQLLAGFSDLDGDALSVLGLSADHGIVVAEPGGFAITLDPDYYGPVLLSYQVDDGNGGSTSATQTFAVNGAPDVTGPVMASATEGGGVYIFDPLANASDPDAGDGLVVVPVGPLPPGVSFVGGSAATISFSDYALGSVVGQHGWTDGSPGSPDNAIVDVSGNRMLRLSNDPTSGDFGGPFSPAFAIAAGEGGAAADTLSFSFVVRAVNNVADGSRLEIDLGSSDRDDRYNFMALEYTAGGLRLVQNTPLADTDGNWQSNDFDFGTGNVQLGALLDASVSHTIHVVFRTVDGSNNDIVEYYVDGVLVGTGSTFENFAEFHLAQPHGDAINSVNNVLFRAGDPAGNPFPADGPGGNRQGFYIDDLAMSAYDSHQLQFNADDPAYDHLAAGATQLVTVNYNVVDGHGGVTPASTVITVTGTNDGATITGTSTGAAVESGVGPGNTPFSGTPSATGTLTVNDVDDGENELIPIPAGAGVYGTFAVAANGSWTYTLNNADGDTNALYLGQVVTDAITVQSEDGTASQTITVTITGTNDAPDAVNDTASAVEDGAVVLGTVAGNDSDVDTGATRSWALVAPVAGLTLDSAGNYVFNPLDPAYQHIAAGATQTVAASYRVTDEHGATDIATLTITVSGTNDAPDASNDVNSAAEDGALVTGNVGSNDTDVDDGATRTFALVAAPPTGLTFNPDGSYSFNPSNAAYQHLAVGATDTLVIGYTISDGSATDTATLTITVNGTNDAPVAADDVNSAIEDGAIATGSVATGDTDVDDGATRTYALNGSVAGLTIASNGSYSFDPASYDSIAAGDTQIVAANYTVTDQHGATDIGTLTITVSGVNDAPDAVNDTNTAVEDGAVVNGTVAANDSDVDIGDTRTYTLNAPIAGLTLNSNGSYSFNPANAAYQHIALGATQTVVATYTLADNHGGSDTATLTFTVAGTNDAPDAVADTIVATEDGLVVSGSLATNDTDADDGATRSYFLLTPVAGLSVTPTGSYNFDPASYDTVAAGATLTLVASYRVIDNNGASDTATITITINGVNDAPDAINDSASAIEDGATVTGNVSFNDLDPDSGDSRTYAQVGSVAGLTFNPDGSYSFNPSDVAYQHIALGATQVVVATYTMTDGLGVTDTATLTITVNGRNDAPVAFDDAGFATEDGPVVTGNVGDNDNDVDDGAARGFTFLGALPAGLTVDADGSYSFDPSDAAYQNLAAGATQNVSINYVVTDQHGATDTGTLTITVTGTNDAPVALADTATAIEDGPAVTGNVGANDSDADDGATRTFALNASVAGLTLDPDGSYSFDPSNAAYQHIALGATQTVVATYTATDNLGATATATLTITVTGANDAPDGVNDSKAATEDGAVVTGNVGANDTDIDDGATRTFALDAPVAGLTLNPDGSYSFNPADAAYQHIALGATQAVVATYTVTDDHGATDTATLTITVSGANDAPDGVNDSNNATEDGAVVTGSVATNDTDIDDAATRTYALNGSVAGLTIASDGSYSFNPSNAAYQHIAAGATQVVIATYTVTDDHGATDTATLTINVTGANDAPDAVNDTNSATEDGAVVVGSVATNDTDADDGATRTYALNAPVAGLTLNPDGTYGFNPSNAAYQSLAAGATQLVVATSTVTDDHGATDIATLTITVTGVNDGPDAVNDVAGATEDGAVVTGTVATNDTDADAGDTRTYALVAPVVGLTLNSSGSYSFDPSSYDSLAAGATQNLVATYTLTDGQGATDTATLTITVTGINDAPDAANDVASATEDGAVVTGTVATNDSDVDVGDTRTYTLNAPVAGLTLDSSGSYSFDPASYDSLALGATQIVAATYTLTDGQGATDIATLTITVTGVNDAPDAANDVAGATEDGAVVTGSVATNDTDADAGDTRTYTLNAPVVGLTLNSSGSYSFDPSSYDSLAAGATQNLVATYTLTDGQGATDTATLTITVTGINDAPDAVNDVASATEDGAVVTGTIATNDTDVDVGDARTYALNAPVAGLTLDSSGSYSFDPSSYDSLAAGATQIVVATYTMTDSQGATDTATLTITVTGIDDAPVAQPDSFTTTEAAVLSGNVLANNGSGADSDVDGPALTVSAVNGLNANVGVQITLSSGARLTLNADGTFTYDPNHAFDTTPTPGSGASNAPGYDIFSYTLSGGATTTVTITLTGLDTDDILRGTAGSDVLIGGNGNDTYFIENAGDVVVEEIGGGNDRVVASVSYALGNTSVETLEAATGTASIDLTGNNLVNTILGNAGGNTLIGGGGADTLIGGGGNDNYRVEEAGDMVLEAIGGGADAIYAVVSYTLGAGSEVELLSAIDPASTVAMNLTGNEFANIIYGNAGSNTLIGGAGNDTLLGGGGSDFYRVETAGDLVLEAVGGGSDAVYAVVSYTLAAGSEVELLSAIDPASTAAMNLTGNEFANMLIGTAGSNTLIGGGGADTLIGGAGNDFYRVEEAGDVVLEAIGGGSDAVYAVTSYTLTAGSEIELLSSIDPSSTAAMNLTGNEFDNTIIGTAGANTLIGGGGNDVLAGGLGNDVYRVEDAGDIVLEYAGGGADSVYATTSYTLAAGYEVELLSAIAPASTAAMNLTGNEYGQYVIGNNGANIIDGKGGSDSLIGGGGADIFAFTTALGAGNADAIVDFAAGTDKIGLDDAVFTAIGATLNANAFVIGAAAADADDRIIYNQATGQLFYDSDGSGGGVAILFATLQGAPVLGVGDFQVI
jgi:VCBS repeat-containing protein